MEPERYKIKIIGHSKVDTHTEYTISIEKGDICFTFSERYSNLKSLNDLMKKSTNSNAFPKFPPRKFFGAEDEKFINKRQQDLNNYFETISNNPQFSNLPPLIKFIKEKKEKYGPSSTKNLAQVKPDDIQLKKDMEKSPQMELKKSIKNDNEDYNKIVNDFSSQFYDMNSFFDKEMTNDNDSFAKYFKNNKINNNDKDLTTLDSGNDNNFNYICQKDGSLESMEKLIKEKIDNISELYKSYEMLYNTKDIIVPI